MKQRYDLYKPSGIDWIGEIPSHWESCTLKQACYSIRNGYVGPTKDILVEAGIPYIQSLHVKNGEIQFDRGEYFVTENWGSKHPKIYTDDIVIVQTGDIGQVAIIPEEFNGCNCHALIIAKCNKNKAIPSYLCFYLRSTVGKELMLKTKTGATLPHLNSGSICFTQIILPPLAEQEGIAAWLDEKCGEIDAAIAKVDREIELIDELKQSEISRAVTRGLNPNAPLRPSGIDWIGDIPKHWEIVPFKRAMAINNGCDYKHIATEEGYPVIGSGGQFAYASDYLYDGEALLLGRKGTIDRPIHFVGKFWTVDTMFYAVPNNKANCKCLYYQSLGFPFDYYSTATALPSMAASDLANNPIVLPPLSEQHEIADYLDKKCAEIDGLKAKLKKKREALVELRQSLISEVVTGKRKVV